MTEKHLLRIAENLSAVPYFDVGETRIQNTRRKGDFNTLSTGLILFLSLLSDYSSLYCDPVAKSALEGRLVRVSEILKSPVTDRFDSILLFCDDVGDVILDCISDPEGFKASQLYLQVKGIKTGNSSIASLLKGVVLELIAGCHTVSGGNDVELIRMVRQISCFLKKLDINRPDLESKMYSDFFLFEEDLSYTSYALEDDEVYTATISEMREILFQHLSEFTLTPFVPRHGPGACADPSIKSWYEKHLLARKDDRIMYLLDKAGLGSMRDYLPLCNVVASSRTARYICVPKTWKKLRGISAEPVELQYFQQGVLHSIDRMFQRDPWWRQRVNLHDQTRSRYLALAGSSNGKYATLDLSAASDSVTLQLVKDLFGNSLLGRWLIGTRSTHVNVNGETIRTSKFAPMGSACCFPVECIVFTLIAEVAIRHTKGRRKGYYAPVVFGDDIIIPTFAARECERLLTYMGFSVNSEKSYIDGAFREACGMEAWNGFDITPCRFRKLPSGLDNRRISSEEVSSVVALCNELYARGLYGTRSYLLQILLNKRIALKGWAARIGTGLLFTEHGDRNTVASVMPTNFNLEQRWSKALQTLQYKVLVFVNKPIRRVISDGRSELLDLCEYTDRLIRLQEKRKDIQVDYLDVLDSFAADPYQRLPLGTMMVPTYKWVVADLYDN